MLEFIAFNVDGSCFLIKDFDLRILIDCGHTEADVIIPKVKEHLIAPDYVIDLAICTHYDADHYFGFIEIPEGNEVKINELWIPSRGHKDDKDVPDRVAGVAEKIVWQNGLDLNVQYFKYKNNQSYSFKEFNITALNASPVDEPWASIGHLSGHKLYKKFKAEEDKISTNAKSFVFLYESITNILLTADSTLAYIRLSEKEKEKISLATIPHHGSNNSKEFDNFCELIGCNVTSVRSNKQNQTHNAACGKLKTTYCTYCYCNDYSQDIHLIYKEDEWMPLETKQCCMQSL